MPDVITRRNWPHLVLVLPPEAGEALDRLAVEHYRDRKREALRLLMEALERETHAEGEGQRAGRRPRRAPRSGPAPLPGAGVLER